MIYCAVGIVNLSYSQMNAKWHGFCSACRYPFPVELHIMIATAHHCRPRHIHFGGSGKKTGFIFQGIDTKIKCDGIVITGDNVIGKVPCESAGDIGVHVMNILGIGVIDLGSVVFPEFKIGNKILDIAYRILISGGIDILYGIELHRLPIDGMGKGKHYRAAVGVVFCTRKQKYSCKASKRELIKNLIRIIVLFLLDFKNTKLYGRYKLRVN